MPRWVPILLLLAAVVCAGIGTDHTAAFSHYGAASSGWTAYSPLSKTVYSASYSPINTTWLLWAPRLGVAMLALGAGTAGATLTAIIIGARGRKRAMSTEAE